MITFIITSPSLVSIPSVRAERRYHGPLLARSRQVRTAEGPAGLVAVVRKTHGKWETYGKKTRKIQRNQLELQAFSWEKDET